MKIREYWLDYLRAFACILVTFGHLLMSFQDAKIIHSSSVISVFIEMIYQFHVYIFFFCSGFLFQNRSENHNKSNNLYQIEKAINYFILYVFYSGVTYTFKYIFSAYVNTSVENRFLDVLLLYPISQMWYMYAISILYLAACKISSKKNACILVITAWIIKAFGGFLTFSPVFALPVYFLFSNMLWFVTGQVFAYGHIRLNWRTSILFACLFILLFSCCSMFTPDSMFLSTLTTLFGILASAGIIYNLTAHKTSIGCVINYLSRYILQIYLLHTIFAAGIRILLLKVGITHILPHLLLGIVCSFVFPVLCAILAEQIPFLSIIFYPVQTVKTFLQKSKS